MALEEDERRGSRFLNLPAEIRDEIYRNVLHPANNRDEIDDERAVYDFAPALVLFRINRQIYFESRKIFRALNVFIRVETPWPEAQHHVARVGHVAVVCSGDHAAKFTGHSLELGIDAPQAPIDIRNDQRWIIALDDLERFTEMWQYSDLSHDINQHLRLTLALRDIHSPRIGGDQPQMSKALQRRLLLPFKLVKNLNAMEFKGEPAPFTSIIQEIRAVQAEPYMTPEQCLIDATRHKQEGNTALLANRYYDALESYLQAWRAIHIVVRGRERFVHGDRLFARILHDPPYQGKHGEAERLVLRVQLVANTCLVYLKLEKYEECEFWGLRTINVLREAMGADEGHYIRPEDEARLGFPGADQMGKIYYRTALALKELGRKAEARGLLQVATIYLPRDESIKREIAACALRLG